MTGGHGRLARLAAAAALLCAGGCSAGAQPGDGGFRLALEDPRNGSPVEVAPGSGALHVVLFATWCPPCEAELDRLGELEARWKDRGYELVLVAVPTRQTAERLAQYVAEKSPPGRLLFDARGAAEGALGSGELPTHVVFDAAGREVVRAGSLDHDVEAAVERLLGGRRSGGGRTP
jgi:thiol-disulfide isomerase/thioredoxin